MSTTSLKWSRISGLKDSEAAGQLIPLAERFLADSLTAGSVEAYAKEQLPELATEFAAPFVAIMQRKGDWTTLSQYGRHSLGEIPRNWLTNTIDEDQGSLMSFDQPAGWKAVAAPLPAKSLSGGILILAGRSLPDEVLPSVLLLVRALGHAFDEVANRVKHLKRIEQLRTTLKIATVLSTVHETEPLLEQIAHEATRLLECDRASIFLWDKDQREVVARPALGVAGNSLRLSDKTGIVGEVIHTARLIRVDDAYRDSRFNQKVDASSGYKTRNLLCGPLLAADGKVFGAFEVINKHVGEFSDEDETTLLDLGSQVAAALQNTRERESLTRSHRQLTEQLTKGVSIIGESAAIVALRGTVARLAETDLPVLILGESGTGKEVVSQSLHFLGSRAEKPFIAVNCAALTETLLESELFGHEKGSFTDAHDMRRGKFELADGGTLFLDEIGDMSLGGQAKLLRVLENKVITRVGGAQTIPINTRVIAATNSNLVEAVRNKRFREDLYFRLNVVTLDLKPLRDRAADVIPLAEHFLKLFSVQAKRPRLSLSDEARKRLQAHNWPGNVRELRNLMERVAFLAPGEKVEAEDLAFILDPDRSVVLEPSPDLGLGPATSEFQKDFIRRAISRVKGNMSEAARLLGLHRSNLYRKMRQLGMHEAPPEGEEGDEG
jgi:transcriptional regulator with GAF, ATPase, and Fis domain